MRRRTLAATTGALLPTATVATAGIDHNPLTVPGRIGQDGDPRGGGRHHVRARRPTKDAPHARPGYWKFVPADIDAHGATAMPSLYRIVTLQCS